MARIKLGLVPKKKKWGVQLLWCQWPFKEKETLEFIERIERLKSLFDLATGELQQSQLKKIENNVQHLVQAAQGSHGSKNTEDQIIQCALLCARTNKPNREVIINWLYSEAFDKRHTEISGRRQPNTGEWILKEPEVQDWENGKSKSRLLWGYGIPGAGKTFLSSFMIDHLKNRASTSSKCGVAYIYFNYSEQAQQNPLSVLASLTKQLACQLQELPTEINKPYKNIIDKQKNPSLEERYNIFLIIAKAFAPGNVFLVCDALDECKQDTQRKILLPLFHRMTNDGMNLFITSREFPDDIQTSFKNSSKIRLWAKNEDINVSAERVRQWDVNVKQLLAALKKLNDSSSKDEPTMDPTYDRVMESIRLQEGNCTELALKILFWLANARRVLTVRELQVTVSIENDCPTFEKTALADRNTLLDVCAGLMTIDQENNEEENDLKDTVRLAHYTIQEYLLRKSITPNDGDMQIATACITFISYDHFTQGACTPHKSDESNGPDGSNGSDEPDKSDEYRSYLHTFLKYVVVYLTIHLGECDETLTTQLVLQFLENPQVFLVYVEGHLLLDDPYCELATPLHFAAG
ncbi:uncharacterized protein H6S33_007816 [Morchella sextelata]|uniref:uncharacterized protein n=1 Tax=Morchella sextelata TaxID=1174677 RepID=UPI001D046458|nr:uncharacterized protein H6S33_007816 [Morchella sextelata]KAH0603494.1 hypothetical protein H6S33_007816 [Morchella sextelata]